VHLALLVERLENQQIERALKIFLCHAAIPIYLCLSENLSIDA
jgi:hypothetical protein